MEDLETLRKEKGCFDASAIVSKTPQHSAARMGRAHYLTHG